jgi:hypothetical protein
VNTYTLTVEATTVPRAPEYTSDAELVRLELADVGNKIQAQTDADVTLTVEQDGQPPQPLRVYQALPVR